MIPPRTLRLGAAPVALRPVLAGEPAEPLARFLALVHEDAPAEQPGPERVRGAGRVVAQSAAWFEAHGYGVWLLVPDGARDAIGWCGLEPGGDPAAPELMYGLVPAARGSGLATDAVRAVVAFAFALPGTVRVWGAARPDNAPSARVMERAGLVLEGRRVLDGEEYVVFGTCAPT